MPQLKVGLAPNKASFFDPKTNTYITLDNPVQTIQYDDTTDLSGICHACMVMHPALILYEGKFPQATIDAWKAKFDLKGLKQAKDRADKVQAASADVVQASSVEKAKEVIEAQEVKAQEAEESKKEEVNEEAEVQEKKEKPKEKKKSTRKSKQKAE